MQHTKHHNNAILTLISGRQNK